MPFNVNDFKQNLINEGARPTLFDVQFTLPPDVANNGVTDLAPQEVQFRCKAAQLPASTVGLIEVPYFGRKIKVAGDRTFADWTITIINDESFSIRTKLQGWSNSINQHVSNTRPANNYKTNINVTQYSKANTEAQGLVTYTLYNCWPSEIAAIDLSWETNDTIEEYTVTWQYDYWQLTNTGGVASGTAFGLV